MKNILNHLSRGFLYTIGRILAIIFILLVIATLIAKIPVDSIDIPNRLKEAIY